MTLFPSWKRNNDMGTICSSKRKNTPKLRTSLTSSSDVTVDVAKKAVDAAAGGKAGRGIGDHGSGISTASLKQSTSVRNDSEKSPVSHSRNFQMTISTGEHSVLPSSRSFNPSTMTSATTESSMCPACQVPQSLRRVPQEMQNLLMGRWPVPPTPGSKCLRIFVAAEEIDSQLERTCLTKTVYPGLRVFTEELGFHLHIVDTHVLQYSRNVPHEHLTAITRRAMNDSIDIWLIHLNNKIGWRLPTWINETDFLEILHKLKEKDKRLASHLSDMYRVDKNSVPPAYRCIPPDPNASEPDCLIRHQLFDGLCNVVTGIQDEMYMYEGFPEEVTTALDHHASMSDNIIVARRNLFHLPRDKTHEAHRKYMDINSEGGIDRHLMQKHSLLVSRVEHVVSNECIIKWNVSWEEMVQSLLGVETSYMKTMRTKVEEKLKAAVCRMVARQASIDPYLAAGLPPVLCQELLMHAHKQQHLLRNFSESLPVVETALERLHAEPTTPLLLTGNVGSGMQTVASILALHEAQRDTACMMALRYMTLTPESQTAMGTLFTVLEQVTIGFGGHKIFKDLKLHPLNKLPQTLRNVDSMTACLSFSNILSAIATSTGKESVTIILCNLRWSMLSCGAEDEWLPQTLPAGIRLIILTCCPILCEKLKGMSVDIPLMKPEQIEKFFMHRMAAEKRCLTPQQHMAVKDVLTKSLLPTLAVLMVELAVEWSSDTPISSDDLPQSPEDAMRHLFAQTEAVVGTECVSRIMSYLSKAKQLQDVQRAKKPLYVAPIDLTKSFDLVSRFGLSDSEMEDVLSLDDNLLGSLYQSPNLPTVRVFPLTIWLYVRHKFAPVMDMAYVYGHRIHRWQRQAVASTVVMEWYGSSVDFLSVHTQLADYFRGKWANQSKPLPDHKSSTVRMVPCTVIAQPNSYGHHVNCRKFLCLLHHMLEGLCSDKVSLDHLAIIRDSAAKHHLLNVWWLVSKLDATSLVQLLDDLQVAMRAAQIMSTELSWLQLLVAQHAAELNVSGRQLHTILQAQIVAEQTRKSASATSKMRGRRISFNQAMTKFKTAITTTSVPYFICSNSCSEYSLGVPSSTSATNQPVSGKAANCLNGIFSFGKNGKNVVSISTGAGEIVVWDITNHTPVQTLRNVDQPKNLVFLDEKRVVVLCNRELKTFDLEAGQLVTNIRGMLNIKMPYFHVRDANTVIVLARNRMSVNVLDVNTGQIHATFKAGEDRFLDSLLVSGNGKILVCGDETQKPFPLLVWELGQSKLLHDLRMSQHEFITSIADITYDGHYIACACRGVYDVESNFVVVYDLTSGQLYRQFRLPAGSVTALAVASDTLATVMVISDGSMIVHDILTGNCKFKLSGVNAIYNRVQLSKDEKQAVTFSVASGMNPIACTVAYWDICKGSFLASYTFEDPVTCCCHVDHDNIILVGLASLPCYLVLSLFTPSVHSTDEALSEASLEEPLWKVL